MDYQLFDVIQLKEDVPEEHLKKGMIGSIVELLGSPPEHAYEVEFCDTEGRTIATLALRQDQMLRVG